MFKKDRELDFYRRLRQKIKDWIQTKQGKSSKWAEYIMLAPDLFYLLYKLVADPAVPVNVKTKLALVITYFISPVDLLPEAIMGPVGFVDDIALTAYALHSIINELDPEILQKHWAGDQDVLEVLKNIMAIADDIIGSGLWKRLKQFFS